MKTFSESQNPSFLAKNMGHYLECFGTLWDIFHANRFFSSLGQFPGQYFSFRDTFLPIFVQKTIGFLPRERRFLISILGVFYLPLSQLLKVLLLNLI